jgi:hypothetical protein
VRMRGVRTARSTLDMASSQILTPPAKRAQRRSCGRDWSRADVAVGSGYGCNAPARIVWLGIAHVNNSGKLCKLTNRKGVVRLPTDER